MPVGNPDGGQWTRDGEGQSSDDSATASVSARGTQYAALETEIQSDTPGGASNSSTGSVPTDNGSTNGSDDRYAALTVERYDRTGDPLIDRTSDILFQTLVRDPELMDRVLALLGKVGPALYGTLVHVAFAKDVRSQDVPGIGQDGVEQSFSAEDVVEYGADGSIRTDVVMRDQDGHVIAIWDVKTGNAELTDTRRQEIRDEVGVFTDVPVIELHICRGVTCKLSRTDA